MRKAILLATAAAIVGVFAVPGAASANWTKHHTALASGETVEVEITGTDLKFESEVGGVTCIKTISRADFTGGTTTGKVTTFEPELNAQTPTITSDCQGTGLIGQCDVHEAAADPAAGGGPGNLNWTIHTVSAGTASVTTGTMTFTLSGLLCPHTLDLTPGTVHFHVAANEINTTSTATLEPAAQLLRLDGDFGNLIESEFFGTFHVLGTITYGI